MLSEHRSWITLCLVAALATGIGACSDDGPTVSEQTSFLEVQNVLVTNCGGCHTGTSSRVFKVTMDSATLHGSGLIDPADPQASLLLIKPRSSSHGGGIVAGLTDANIDFLADWIGTQPPVQPRILVANLAFTAAMLVDGIGSEHFWTTAQELRVPISGGWAGEREVQLRAAYDATYVYVLATWPDDAVSEKRQPWQKQLDGTWRALAAKQTPADGTDWAEYLGVSFDPETAFYEDKFAIMWNTYGPSTVAGFEENGCAAMCHDPANSGRPGNTYFYSDEQRAAKKYTNAAAEIADMWHWKLIRMNQHGKLDDQYVGFWQVGMSGPESGGRFSDAGSGGYANNPATNGAPTFRGPDLSKFYIFDAEKVPLSAAELAAMPVGQLIANMITSGPTGTRADVDARGKYNPFNRTWTVEMRRRLVTGDSKDVQFSDFTRDYSFGIAFFDNAQIEHSWSPLPYRLRFIR